jgi:Bacterial archaeo-eukaryotic release factor family 3
MNMRRTELRELAEARKGPCLSIFAPGGAEADSAGEVSRLKGLIERGRQLLESQGWTAEVSEEVCRPMRTLAAQCRSGRREGEGCALFGAPGFFRVYPVPFDLPELVAVAGGFHLKPLIPLVEASSGFHLLALSHGAARFYHGDREGLEEVDDVALPLSPFAVAAGEDGHRRALDHLIFHGYRARDERRKQLLTGWFRRVDETIRCRLGQEGDPLVLAGVGYLCSLFRHVSRAEYVLEQEIHGSPEGIGAGELHQRGQAIADSFFQAMRERTVDEYYQLWHTPRASNDVRNIASAARDGRIKTLFVSSDFHPGPPPLELGDRELLDAAALQTFIAGGRVYTVTPELVPGRGAAAAIFRY